MDRSDICIHGDKGIRLVSEVYPKMQRIWWDPEYCLPQDLHAALSTSTDMMGELVCFWDQNQSVLAKHQHALKFRASLLPIWILAFGYLMLIYVLVPALPVLSGHTAAWICVAQRHLDGSY